jgi:cysteine/glycine-rich protein
MSRAWHSQCFKCKSCSKRLESGTANLQEEDLYCNACHRKLFSAPPPSKEPLAPYINKEDQDCCPRCGKRVYFAEQVAYLQRKWHTTCFTCATCNKRVDSATASDHSSDLYCRPCYGRNFGPKGYGFAGGAGGLSMDTTDGSISENIPKTGEAYLLSPVSERMKALDLSSPTSGGEEAGDGDGAKARPRWVGGEYCPRCKQQVYIAEKRAAAGNAFHEKCFSCLDCAKKLEQGKLSERDGEIYCKTCYGKQFGPKGYGYGGGAGALQMA